MDRRRYIDKQETSTYNEQKLDREQDSLIEDFTEDFRLPKNHRPTENVDLDNVEQASLDTKLTASNVGFRLLQKMGWKGKGLGKDEQGMPLVEPNGCTVFACHPLVLALLM
ncbi:hypothetical protein OIU77_003712 [Salix suchowensis]|uniref:G-patch domain-containing protein n=1 Tax=Salix suchowensis TaxID=1278906 RepID=A0ABQ9ATE0_9ROSI|nr:hypothetical protein OIU77_003712 [Salix suchowensis]